MATLAWQLVGGDVDSFDARGRAMYGDAWDEGIENGLPLREVFLMSDQEAAELRRLARIQADAARAERAEAASHREVGLLGLCLRQHSFLRAWVVLCNRSHHALSSAHRTSGLALAPRLPCPN